MVKFLNLFYSFLFIGLISFSLFALTTTLQEDNDTTERFSDNALINSTFNTLKTDLEGLRDQSQSQKTLFESEKPTSGFGTILLFSIVSSGKVFNSMIVGTFNTLVTLPTTFLGLDPVILSIFSTILIITIIIGLWILYKLGG